MPLSIYKCLNIGPLKETYVIIEHANQFVVYPKGRILEDVLVQVNKLVFPANFHVLDMKEKRLMCIMVHSLWNLTVKLLNLILMML